MNTLPNNQVHPVLYSIKMWINKFRQHPEIYPIKYYKKGRKFRRNGYSEPVK